MDAIKTISGPLISAALIIAVVLVVYTGLLLLACYVPGLRFLPGDVGVVEMKRKRTVRIVILGALLCLVLWLAPRHYSCQRCGARVTKCGPVIVAIVGHYLGGAGGDRGLYCDRNGHALVRRYDPNARLTDWMYHRDSYESEEAYQADIVSRWKREQARKPTTNWTVFINQNR